ncbi:MAG: hypothetical protein ACI9TH_001280 [Kiritimatiellia bacterium]|jgi:hypothetical protein
MNNEMNRLNERSRRDFMSKAACSFLGVSASFFAGCGLAGEGVSDLSAAGGTDAIIPATDPTGTLAASQLNNKPTAKSVIYLYMGGGMSHVDTFDPKDDKDVMAETQAIATNVDGIRLGHWMEKTARHMDKVALINSLSSTQGAHGPGTYFMHTSYAQRSSITHPRMGSWISRLSGPINSNLPASVFVGQESVGGGAGFLASKYGALGISDPEQGLRDSRRPGGVSQAEFDKRLELASFLDTQFHGKYALKEVEAYTDMYKDALKMMSSDDLKGFNIQSEPKSVKALYGESRFGQGALLARRLVEHGVRFVEVRSGGWDMHNDIFDNLPTKAGELDRVLAALLQDLELRGMLEETMVVVATEFGRSPSISGNAGRNHYPKAFSGLLAGGGIQGGQVYGKTDKKGANIVENKIGVPDFNATIAYGMGLPYNEIVYSPSKRPFTVADTGTPLVELFG